MAGDALLQEADPLFLNEKAALVLPTFIETFIEQAQVRQCVEILSPRYFAALQGEPTNVEALFECERR